MTREGPPGRPPLQRLPLEAVWPVQTLRAPIPVEPRPAPGVPPSVEAGALPPADAIQAVLQHVSPGQASDSSIEVLPTRRPRPPGLQPAIRPAPLSAPQNRPVGAPAQSTPAGGNQSGAGVGTVQANPPMPEPAAAAGAGETPAPPAGAAAAPVVQTAIGRLPGDLWSLIGQPAPEAAGPSQPSPAGHALSMEGAHSQPVPAAPIQREEETEFAEREPPPDEETPTAPPHRQPDHPPAPEVDIDQLARRVYAEVRRRLNSEWERVRNRW